jgi:hypothetical protein
MKRFEYEEDEPPVQFKLPAPAMRVHPIVTIIGAIVALAASIFALQAVLGG